VWDALRSPAALRACIDGCDALARQGAEFSLTLRMSLGVLRATPQIRAFLQRAERPSHATLAFRADDARAGGARGRIDIALSTEGIATRVHVQIGASLSGPVAQLPARALHIGVRRIAADFCDELDALLLAQSGRGPNRARRPGSGVRVTPRARVAGPAALGIAGTRAVRRTRDAANAAGGERNDGARGSREHERLPGIRAVTWGLVAVLAAVCYWALRVHH
jgi:carbon monoxide dehydrogenase subunit G